MLSLLHTEKLMEIKRKINGFKNSYVLAKCSSAFLAELFLKKIMARYYIQVFL